MRALALGAALTATAVLLLSARGLWMPHTAPGPELRAGWSFERDIQPIFNVACVRCHMHGEAIGSLDLTPQSAYASLVRAPSEQSPRPRVAPGDPEQSYLLDKLEGTHLQTDGSGMPMPMDGGALSAAQIQRVRDWIAAGAPP